MERYLTPEFWLQIAGILTRVAVILIGGGIGFRIFRILIRRFFFGRAANHFTFEEKRAKTLSGLLESICRYALYFVATVMVLQEFHIDTTSIIASAGVIGLAIGVGAQSIVKDFMAGFFIIMEDQYSTGEYIVSGTNEGTVEEIGFRVTKLRDANGVLHVLPNGGITRVSNFNRGSIQTSVNIPVSYHADVKIIIATLQESCDRFKQEHPELIDGPNILGIVEFQAGYMVIRIQMKCVPLTQAKMEAALRYSIRTDFQARELPQAWTAPDSAQSKQIPMIFPEEAPVAISRIEVKPPAEQE